LYPEEEEEEEASIFKQNFFIRKIMIFRNGFFWITKVLISDLNFFFNFIAAFYSKTSDKVLTTDIFKKYFEGQGQEGVRIMHQCTLCNLKYGTSFNLLIFVIHL
jgi:hypothetical protein